mmetsp:Transcript_15869/g.23287  ORF Transcript_15869/g.23287 Transcript_15869/m.23287 type:complete len:245 (+) Transcript_15869:1242-1976(+)
MVSFSFSLALGSRRTRQHRVTRSLQSVRFDWCAELVSSAILTIPHMANSDLTTMLLICGGLKSFIADARRHILVKQDETIDPRKTSPPMIILRREGLLSVSTGVDFASEYTVCVAYVPSARTTFFVIILGAPSSSAPLSLLSSILRTKGASPSWVFTSSKASCKISASSQYSPRIQRQTHITLFEVISSRLLKSLARIGPRRCSYCSMMARTKTITCIAPSDERKSMRVSTTLSATSGKRDAQS